MKNEIIHKQEFYKIPGACFEVYNEKGCGFTEGVFQECLEIELALLANFGHHRDWSMSE